MPYARVRDNETDAPQVLLFCARVSAEVLVSCKLGRVHEDARDHHFALLPRRPSQILSQTCPHSVRGTRQRSEPLAGWLPHCPEPRERNRRAFWPHAAGAGRGQTRCPSWRAPMVGKKPTRSPTARLMPLRHARYSAMLSIVRIRDGAATPFPLRPSRSSSPPLLLSL